MTSVQSDECTLYTVQHKAAAPQALAFVDRHIAVYSISLVCK